MTENTEYTFYDGENNTTVNRNDKTVTMYERGGWERSYTLTFDELLNYAKQWDIEINLKDNDYNIAQIATNIILANNAVKTRLDPFLYVRRTDKITDPRDKKLIKKFESLCEKYTSQQIIANFSKKTKEYLNIKKIK